MGRIIARVDADDTKLPRRRLCAMAPGMELLRGEAALTRARALMAAAKVCAVDVDAGARNGGAPQLLVVADSERALVIDVPGTPGLRDFVASWPAVATYDAKTLQRVWLRTYGLGAKRWGCLRLTEQLLLGGRLASLALVDIAARYQIVLPDAASGLDAFAAHGRAVAALVNAQIEGVRRDGLTWPSRIEAAAVAPIAAMEHHGMPFDAEQWRTLDAQSAAERARLRAELLAWFRTHGETDLLGETPLDPDNDHDLKRALHASGHLVPDVRRATVAGLPAPLGTLLSRYRELAKLCNAYGESFLTHVATDGRVHATFEQIGASTGRLSCRDPNLQSVVKDTARRKCFVAASGRTLVIADYATCELRILAEMSDDPVFAEAFANNEDLHARVASRVFGKPVSKHENPHLRERAKAVNFGLVYGMGAAGLARAVGVGPQQAEALLHRYFETFPKIGHFLSRAAHEALAAGFARTLTGRRLYLDPGTDRESQAASERVAKNMPIQGSSADITKIALARLHNALAEQHDAHIVNTVHDEIVVECREADAQEVAALTQREMQAAGAEVLHKTPVVVDVTVSPFWCK